MPDEPEAIGLLALLLLTESRREARTRPDGELIRLGEQDRTLWDRELIEEGNALLAVCLRRNRPGPYQLQAAIAAVHVNAARAEDTDWQQIVRLYDRLYALTPTPIVALNRAIAVAETGNVEDALATVDDLELDGYHLYHATRGHFLDLLGHTEEADHAYARAIELTTNETERRHLQRLREVTDRGRTA
jgi:RNA polymerase sigma-70 factor (ECF subfamily)